MLEDLADTGCDVPDGTWGISPDSAAAALEDLAELHVRFRPSDKWLEANAMIKGAIGLVQNARQGDGSYVFTFTGPLARMTPRPGR